MNKLDYKEIKKIIDKINPIEIRNHMYFNNIKSGNDYFNLLDIYKETDEYEFYEKLKTNDYLYTVYPNLKDYEDLYNNLYDVYTSNLYSILDIEEIHKEITGKEYLDRLYFSRMFYSKLDYFDKVNQIFEMKHNFSLDFSLFNDIIIYYLLKENKLKIAEKNLPIEIIKKDINEVKVKVNIEYEKNNNYKQYLSEILLNVLGDTNFKKFCNENETVEDKINEENWFLLLKGYSTFYDVLNYLTEEQMLNVELHDGYVMKEGLGYFDAEHLGFYIPNNKTIKYITKDKKEYSYHIFL